MSTVHKVEWRRTHGLRARSKLFPSKDAALEFMQKRKGSTTAWTKMSELADTGKWNTVWQHPIRDIDWPS